MYMGQIFLIRPRKFEALGDDLVSLGPGLALCQLPLKSINFYIKLCQMILQCYLVMCNIPNMSLRAMLFGSKSEPPSQNNTKASQAAWYVQNRDINFICKTLSTPTRRKYEPYKKNENKNKNWPFRWCITHCPYISTLKL